MICSIKTTRFLILFATCLLFALLLSDEQTASAANCGGITHIRLIDIDTGRSVPDYDNVHWSETITLNLAEMPANFNIEVVTSNGVESVKGAVDGVISTENVKPYHYPYGKENPWKPSPGMYRLVATAFSKDSANGTRCDRDTFEIIVIDEVTTIPGEPCGTIMHLNLYDRTLEQPIPGYSNIAKLSDTTVYLADLPSDFSIEVVTTEVGIGSVHVLFDGNVEPARTEGYAPYTFPYGSSRGWTPVPGTYVVSASAYSEGGRQGELCDQTTFTLTVVEQSAQPPRARLSLKKSSDRATVTPGAIFNYYLVISNRDAAAQNVVLTNQLPMLLTILNLDATHGGDCSSDATINIVICTWEQLADGDEAVVIIEVAMPDELLTIQ